MTIYNNKRINYRKIYEDHYGKIPIDSDGRKFDIHHIDGNKSNNNISNLKAISIQDHYNIHYEQRDWAACNAIAIRMKIPLLMGVLIIVSMITTSIFT
ncbi:MAG: HNH endonuclease, partial [Acetobacteraceae bacterium]|nr:HNH endonuclease [Acetobacteraceae bacterium]